MNKVHRICCVLNKPFRLERVTYLLIVLLLFQSGVSFASQCDDYSSDMQSRFLLSTPLDAVEADAAHLLDDDTFNEESECRHCVLCKCAQIKCLTQQSTNSLVKAFYTDQYFYFRNMTDAPVKRFLRPPKK